MKFIDGNIAANQIKLEINRTERVRIAVAYWGKGAIKLLGLKEIKGRKIELICDLESGACNPDEIRDLRVLFGKERVLKCRGLHAKVWITDKAVIVGSSNSSTNGLTQEGKESSGLIEANIVTVDLAAHRDAVKWFDTLVRPNATEITDADLNRARRRWENIQRFRPAPPQSTLLNALIANPDCMRGKNVFVYAWPWEDASNPAEDAFVQEIEMRKGSEFDSEIEFYELDKETTPSAGSYVIDFDTKSGTRKFKNVYRVLLEDHIVDRNGTRLVLCKPIGREIDGLKLGDMKKWTKAISESTNSNTRRYYRPIEAFAKEYLKAP